MCLAFRAARGAWRECMRGIWRSRWILREAQADEHGHALRDEVRVLLLHGLLHLSGMDHETDRGRDGGA